MYIYIYVNKIIIHTHIYIYIYTLITFVKVSCIYIYIYVYSYHCLCWGCVASISLPAAATILALPQLWHRILIFVQDSSIPIVLLVLLLCEWHSTAAAVAIVV